MPKVLITTSLTPSSTDLKREDAVTGRNYSVAVRAAGGLPMMVAVSDPSSAQAYAASHDALVLSGGGDVDPAYYGQAPHPELGRVDARRDEFEIALYRAFRELGKPVLGICRGLQVINVAQGGTLHQHIPALPGSWQHSQRDMRGVPIHTVELTPGGTLARYFGETEIRTNTYHHQGIDRLGEGLKVSARAGDGLIEAIENDGGSFVLAVQWHPEMAFTVFPEHRAPFDILISTVRSAVNA